MRLLYIEVSSLFLLFTIILFYTNAMLDKQ